MKLRIRNLSMFERTVFGADIFLKHFKDSLLVEGVPVKKLRDMYYIVKDDGGIINSTCFFSEDEIKRCMELC